MRLFIAEKPSLARAIAEGLGGQTRSQSGYIRCQSGDHVTWCVGHLLEQAEPHLYDAAFKKWSLTHLPIVPQRWKLVPKKKTHNQLKVIQGLLAKSTQVIHAGDPDREGQLLVDQVLNFLGVGRRTAVGVPVLRLLIHDLNLAAVRRALAKLDSNQTFAALSRSALARQRADWLYGINMTRAYTLLGRQSGYDGLLSVGRVQTPVLGLVVRRDREIAQFQPKPYFEVLALLESGDSELSKLRLTAKADSQKKVKGDTSINSCADQFHARWEPSSHCEQHQDEQGRVLNKKLAEHVAKRITRQVAKVIELDQKKRSLSPPLPYSLSALQVEVGRRYGMSAQKVLDCAQRLYEQYKLITYPRSDCRYLPETHHAMAVQIKPVLVDHIKQLCDWVGRSACAQFSLKGFGAKAQSPEHALKTMVDGLDLNIKGRAWNDKLVGAHHAIVPTSRAIQIQKLSDDEKLVYESIVRQYLLQFLPAYRYLETQAVFEIQGGRFKVRSECPIDLGWRSVVTNPEHSIQLLPKLKVGQCLNCLEGQVIEKMTSPPSYFTDSSLIQAMTGIARFVQSAQVRKVLRETDGLGTEATRAGIVELLVTRGYLTRIGKQLRSTPQGEALIDMLPQEATWPDMTAQWESYLEKISQKIADYDSFMSEVSVELDRFMDQVKTGQVLVGEQLKTLSKLQSGRRYPSKRNYPPVSSKGKKSQTSRRYRKKAQSI